MKNPVGTFHCSKEVLPLLLDPRKGLLLASGTAQLTHPDLSPQPSAGLASLASFPEVWPFSTFPLTHFWVLLLAFSICFEVSSSRCSACVFFQVNYWLDLDSTRWFLLKDDAPYLALPEWHWLIRASVVFFFLLSDISPSTANLHKSLPNVIDYNHVGFHYRLLM